MATRESLKWWLAVLALRKQNATIAPDKKE